MEGTIRVVTDSSCDLPPGLLKEYGIEVVTLIVHFGTDTYHDGALSVERFWEKTAARSFEGALKRVLNLVEGMGPLEELAVGHTRNHDTANGLVERLATRAHFPKEHVWMRETGAVLASHAGPGVIGVLAVPTAGND